MNETDSVQLLMEEIGCEQSEAELALTLADNNLEKAIDKINILLKYIKAFKIKVIFPADNIYGLIHLAVNMKNADILRSSMVFSHSPYVYEIRANMDWFSFEKAIFSTRLDAGTMESYTQNVEEKFKLYIGQALQQIPAVSSIEIADIIKAFFYPSICETEIVSEELSLSQFKKLPDFTAKQNETSFTGYDLGFVQLEVEIIEDLGGKPARSICEGDTLLSLITDERDIAYYLAHLIGGRKEGQMVPLAAMVKKISANNENFTIHLHYAPSITGLAIVNDQTKLKVLDTKNQPWWKKIMPW
jgi:hypothetical protein